MHFPTAIVDAINSDRIREANAARPARGVEHQPELASRRPRRIRLLASHLAFSITR